MFSNVHTILPILVQVVRIPDARVNLQRNTGRAESLNSPGSNGVRRHTVTLEPGLVRPIGLGVGTPYGHDSVGLGPRAGD